MFHSRLIIYLFRVFGNCCFVFFKNLAISENRCSFQYQLVVIMSEFWLSSPACFFYKNPLTLHVSFLGNRIASMYSTRGKLGKTMTFFVTHLEMRSHPFYR